MDAVEEALDDTVAVDDPRVAETAAQRHAFERTLMTVLEESGIEEAEAALLDAALFTAHPQATEDNAETDARDGGMSVFEAVTKLPHGLSPARVRCAELAPRRPRLTTHPRVDPAKPGGRTGRHGSRPRPTPTRRAGSPALGR
ncbi:hypothetical protein ACWGB8_12930 [Kitasatospora sp. NPDC054939]